MKFKAIILSSVLAISVLAGCSSNSDNSSKQNATTTSTTIQRTTTTTTYSLVDKFVSTVKTRLPNSTRSEIVDLGQQACVTIRAYGSIELAIYGIASDPSWTTDMAKIAAFVMGAAIPVFCPEYTAELQRIAR